MKVQRERRETVSENRKKRTRTVLLDEVEKRLKAYALAAGATGVSLVAINQPANAEIVYTPANQTLTYGQVPIDLNGDGINDFILAIHSTASYTVQNGHYLKRALDVGGNTGASILVSNGSAGALAKKARIGLGSPFKNVNERAQKMLVATSFASSSGLRHSSAKGNWKNAHDKFLGFKFLINGEVHYGWARLTVRYELFTRISATLLGFAYESTANRTIRAGRSKGQDDASLPEVGTLGTLARGAVR